MVNQSAKQYNPVELEKRIQEYWKSNRIYEKVKNSRKDGEDYYFVDGPPYTTGHIHLGTAWNKTLKDVQLRYLRSMGYNVRDQAGFDMHGLPIEVKVEQELGINNKKEIEQLGIDNFIEKCREFGLRFQKQMAEQFKALGVWLDWENPYLTIKNYYIEGAWWTLKKAFEKKLLYTAERNLSWCPRCQTALAEAEVEYWEETDPSIYVKFPISGRENYFLVIWTTTPWTLMSNQMVAVHPDFTYVQMEVEKDGEKEVLLVVEERAEDVAKAGRYQKMKILDKLQGDILEGIKYEHPFKDLVEYHRRTDLEWLHKIVLADYVTEDQTGLVHVAPGHGPDDFETGKEYGLPPFCPIDEAGKYTGQIKKYTGIFTKDADQDIIKELSSKGILLNSDEITHRYGHCWRCKKPITYRTTNQWFLRVTEEKERMLEENARIKWTPDWAGSARFKNWIENTRDWCISRQRYWGIPMPIWKCEKCGNIKVVGDSRELKENGKGYKDNMDLHRPWIDEVTFKCGCGSRMNRVRDVLDVWFDSAVCSWAQLKYPKEKREFERWWPIRWITEAQDQTRGWFYSQLGASVVAFDRAPYDEVLMHGWSLDEKGRPMSKSLGNVVTPSEVSEKFGVDSLRFYLLKASAPWEDLSFSMEGVRIVNRTLNILWNVYYFGTTYMDLDNFSPEKWTEEKISEHLAPEDKWLLSRLENMVRGFNAEFRKHNLHRASREIERFILEDLSRWYVRLIRDRTWSENESQDKFAAYYSLRKSLLTTAEMLSPITPHLSEEIYLNLSGKKESISMENWREPVQEYIDENLENHMEIIRELTDTLAATRQKAEIKLRWPLSKLTIETHDKSVIQAVKQLENLLLLQTNIKSVEFTESWDGLQKTSEPNFAAIGPVFKKEGQKAGEYIRNRNNPEFISEVEKGKVEFRGIKITPEMLKISQKVPDGFYSAEFSKGAVYLDARITRELESEAFGRELVRRIQEMRKEMDLDVEDRIKTTMRVPEELKEKIKNWREHISQETRSASLEYREAKGYKKEWNIQDYIVEIGVEKSE